MAVQLPNCPELTVVDDPAVASRWSEWLDGLEAMMKAMKVATEEDKQDLLFHYGGNDIRKLVKKLPAHVPAEGVYKGL